TLDFALGGTSTSSSKFAVINVNSGTPTASISANNGNNSTYLSGNGTLGTTNFQNLTIGSPSTGNVTINALNGGTGSVITLNALTENNNATTVNYNTGNTVLGTTATNSTLQLNANGTGTLTLNNGATGNIQFFGTSNYLTSNGTLQLQGDIFQPVSGGISGYFQLGSNVIAPSNTINDLAIGGNSTSSALFQIFGATGNATTSGTFTFNNVAGGTIQTTNSRNLTLGGQTTGSIFLNGLNGSGNGINFTGYGTGVLLSGANGNITSGTVNLASSSYVSGILGSVNGGSPFDIGNGSIFERNNTLDLLLGATGTSSAKFAFINVNSGTPTASISANNGNNSTYLSGNGTLGTTNFQNLTIGSPTTGQVILSGRNGANNGITFNGYGQGVIQATGTNGVLTSGAIDLASSSYVSGILGISNGGTGTNSTPTNGQLLIGNGTGYTVANLSAGFGITITNGTGTITIGSNQGTNWFTENAGLIYPTNSTLDFALGGTSTSSSKFAVINVNSGTPTASISANNGNNSTYLSGNGTLGTTNFQNLTLGGTTTGSIFLNGLNGSGNGINFTGYGTGVLLSGANGN
ncbi:MAG: S-layer family protein, partial [Patescibacteria group bacterium]|nr:S-layer family protein [Patescibacteria group bacterium]